MRRSVLTVGIPAAVLALGILYFAARPEMAASAPLSPSQTPPPGHKDNPKKFEDCDQIPILIVGGANEGYSDWYTNDSSENIKDFGVTTPSKNPQGEDTSLIDEVVVQGVDAQGNTVDNPDFDVDDNGDGDTSDTDENDGTDSSPGRSTRSCGWGTVCVKKGEKFRICVSLASPAPDGGQPITVNPTGADGSKVGQDSAGAGQECTLQVLGVDCSFTTYGGVAAQKHRVVNGIGVSLAQIPFEVAAADGSQVVITDAELRKNGVDQNWTVLITGNQATLTAPAGESIQANEVFTVYYTTQVIWPHGGGSTTVAGATGAN